MAERDNAKMATEFLIDKYFTAIKQAGTANGAGLLGGAVALYYFKDRSAWILTNIKYATGFYLVGIVLFAIAYFTFITVVHRHHSAVQLPQELKTFRAEPLFNFTIYAGIMSFSAWLSATCLAAYVLYLL